MEAAFPGPLWAERAPVRFIHRGAWSDTVEARTGEGGRSAVKVAEAGGNLAAFVEGWARCARTAADAVHHAGVSTYSSVDIVDGWLSAERRYVEGVDAGTAVAAGGAAPSAVAAAIGGAIADAAVAVHGAGLLAGSILPSHAMIGRDGSPLLLAASLPVPTVRQPREVGRDVDREVSFAPPERFAGAEVTAAADVFGVAALYHFLATGRAAVPAAHRLGRVLARRGAVLISEGTTPDGIDAELGTIVGAALSASPEERPPLEALRDALRASAGDASDVSSWARAVVGAAALNET